MKLSAWELVEEISRASRFGNVGTAEAVLLSKTGFIQ
jgi:hypothetical protein